eukprot:1387340-Amphidinium_carterae.5
MEEESSTEKASREQEERICAAKREKDEAVKVAQGRAREYALREDGVIPRQKRSGDEISENASQVPRLAEGRGEKRLVEEFASASHELTTPPSTWNRIGHERYSPEREQASASAAIDAAGTSEMVTTMPSLMLSREIGLCGDQHVCQLKYESSMETEDFTYGKELAHVESLHEGEVAFPVGMDMSMDTLTSEETRQARFEELDVLYDFKALRPYKKSDAEVMSGEIWLTSRWVDSRKRKGAPRSRWVLREFADAATTSEFYSSTPDSTMMEVIHVHALRHELDVVYLDVSRAFLHAPEEDYVFIAPPFEAFDPQCPEALRCREGDVWLGLRKLNGRRDGSQSFSRHSSIGFQGAGFRQSRLQGAGFRQSRLHPCFYVSTDGMMLSAEFWVKVEGELPASSKEKCWQVFLGHERARIGSKMFRRPQKKYLES